MIHTVTKTEIKYQSSLILFYIFLFLQILIRMNRLCVQQSYGNVTKPRKHEQRLLRNMGVHSVVLDLLQIPYEQKEDVRMNELMRLAHEFLQNFCLGKTHTHTDDFSFLSNQFCDH